MGKKVTQQKTYRTLKVSLHRISRFLLSIGLKWDGAVTDALAGRGALADLRWAFELGCPASTRITEYAAQGGHIEVLQFLVGKGNRRTRFRLLLLFHFLFLSSLLLVFLHLLLFPLLLYTPHTVNACAFCILHSLICPLRSLPFGVFRLLLDRTNLCKRVQSESASSYRLAETESMSLGLL